MTVMESYVTNPWTPPPHDFITSLQVQAQAAPTYQISLFEIDGGPDWILPLVSYRYIYI